MRIAVALVLLILAAPLATARADEGAVPDARVIPTVVLPATAAEAPSQPSLLLDEVRVPEHRATASTDAVTQEMPRRGSFWWLVGVIVVAGIVLAVLLD